MKTIVLAYSGGLDTSIILTWLIEKGYDVVAYIADVGQLEDFNAIKEKALIAGASSVYVEDLKEEFINEYIFTALKGSAVYEGRYLLGTALSRPLIAKRQIEIARKTGAQYVAHGATGKGNDQVRFELAFAALAPDIGVISPWKDEEFLNSFKGRSDLLAYARKHGLEVESNKDKPPYSMDANLMHISYEGGILENPDTPPPSDMFQMTAAPESTPDSSETIKIVFEKGIPITVLNTGTGDAISGSVNIINYLNALGGKHGIGRIDIVENRYVGIKSRGVYEAPGATILWKAHHDLKLFTFDKEVQRICEGLSLKLADVIYNGYWFSPEMEFLRQVFDIAMQQCTGSVTLTLYKGGLQITGRESAFSPYNPDLSSMDIEGGYDQKDARGFIRIHSLRLTGTHNTPQCLFSLKEVNNG